MRSYLLRVILAASLAIWGFRIAVPQLPPWLILVSTLAGAVLGFFLPPTLVLFWQKFVSRLTKNVAWELARQLKNRFPKPPGLSGWKPKPLGPRPLILDTSALIDGRIGDILRTGFLSGRLILPDFVLSELQKVADSSSSLKRTKGRRGLSILEEIKKTSGELFILKTRFRGRNTDQNLVKLAKKRKGTIITTDFNLNQVAKVSGVTVLNVNELANAVRTAVVPGEQLKIKIVAEGKDRDQGVGYLEDGTMVVVEKGSNLVGREVKVTVARFLQTPAGRMVFARLQKK
jgi:uncharacterized protein YacL